MFSKRLLLIPLHLEIHWSLIAVDVSKQNINFYDSQGILFKFAVDVSAFGINVLIYNRPSVSFRMIKLQPRLCPQNILKYMIAEAKEKKQAAFQKGWKMTVSKVSVS